MNGTLEQRYVIKFFLAEDRQPLEILGILQNHYGEDAMSKSQLYYWVGEIRRGRTDLHDAPSPGRTPDEGIVDAVARRLADDPNSSTRQIARSMKVSLSTVLLCLHNDLGMRPLHRRWIPHVLGESEKVARVECAKSMLQDLQRHASTGFEHIQTGDESWLFYDYVNETQWSVSWEDIAECQRRSHYQKKP